MNLAILIIIIFSWSALIVTLLALIVQPLELKWIAVGGTLVAFLLGVTLSNFFLALRADKTVENILKRIKDREEKERFIQLRLEETGRREKADELRPEELEALRRIRIGMRKLFH